LNKTKVATINDRLSKAILAGCKKTTKAQGKYWDNPIALNVTACCTLGAAMLGSTTTKVKKEGRIFNHSTRFLVQRWPFLEGKIYSGKLFPLPCGCKLTGGVMPVASPEIACCTGKAFTNSPSVFGLIVHMNDETSLTREQIAKWVELVETVVANSAPRTFRNEYVFNLNEK